MKERPTDRVQPGVVRKRVILLALLALGVGAGLTVGVWTFTSRGDSDAAAQRVSQWHGLRLFADDGSWRAIDPGEVLPPRVVLLVHGLDEPGSIWDQLAPALREAGHTTLRFDYPNDQAIADSADLLDTALRRMRTLGVDRVDVVAHSMGGLVTRDALTRPGFLEDDPEARARVERLIAIGTPHRGSPWAGMRWASELREQAERLMGESAPEAEDLYRFSLDGAGQAGADLRPGSDFLTELNTRPDPQGVAITCLVGRLVTPPAGAGAELDALSRTLGDGVVPIDSATLDGCEDVVVLSANHRAMIRSLPLSSPDQQPPGIQVVLDRLSREPAP